jgi:hypothetical protein
MRAWYTALLIVGLTAAGQAQQKAPRTSWGDPDLQGIWSNASLTPLERPDNFKDKEFLSEEEAAALEKGGLAPLLKILAREVQVSGELNDTWLEPGTTVDRNRRTSMITDPKDGKVPYTEAGKKARDAAAAALIFMPPSASFVDRNLVERCLFYDGIVSPNPFYLNNHQIFQSRDHIAIKSEVLGVVRIIPLDGRSTPGAAVTKWFGVSRGRWEGQTLVVETENFKNDTSIAGSRRAPATAGTGDQGLKLVERFTRVDSKTIDYQATISDPSRYTQPWTFVNALRQATGPLYEYACHEGNYGMVNILRGARADEKKKAEADKKKAEEGQK